MTLATRKNQKTEEYLVKIEDSRQLLHHLIRSYQLGYPVVLTSLQPEITLYGRLAESPSGSGVTLENPIMLIPSTKSLGKKVEMDFNDVHVAYLVRQRRIPTD